MPSGIDTKGVRRREKGGVEKRKRGCGEEKKGAEMRNNCTLGPLYFRSSLSGCMTQP